MSVVEGDLPKHTTDKKKIDGFEQGGDSATVVVERTDASAGTKTTSNWAENRVLPQLAGAEWEDRRPTAGAHGETRRSSENSSPVRTTYPNAIEILAKYSSNSDAFRALAIAALVNGASDFSEVRSWLGFGVTGKFDDELPIDSLPMLLLAKALGDLKPVIFLADDHAVLGGNNREEVERRVKSRRRRVFQVCSQLGISPTVVLASELNSVPEYLSAQLAASALVHDERNAADRDVLTTYTTRAIGDAIFFHVHAGRNLKIGWVPKPELVAGRGGFSEFNASDRFLVGPIPGFAAVYTGPGVSTDSTRPIAAPYSVADASVRLMLTGPERGRIREKIERSSSNRRRALRSQVSRIVGGYEALSNSLDGGDDVDKLERLIKQFN